MLASIDRKLVSSACASAAITSGAACRPVSRASRARMSATRAAEGAPLRAYARLGDGTPCDIGSATVGPDEGR